MLAEAIALYSDDSLLGDTHEWSRAAAATLAKWRAQNADGQARALAGSQAQLSGVDGVVLSGLPAAAYAPHAVSRPPRGPENEPAS